MGPARGYVGTQIEIFIKYIFVMIYNSGVTIYILTLNVCETKPMAARTNVGTQKKFFFLTANAVTIQTVFVAQVKFVGFLLIVCMLFLF